MKRMIFHIPMRLDPKMQSGSQIRPVKMIQAFKNIGYQVDVIMGYGEDRKKQISQIKYNIKSGVKYDFLYSESSTMPTLLTEKNHLPTFPFLDFSFFRFCKKHNIKIGLFYRDIHWNFEQYIDSISPMKKIISSIFYKYDLIKYRQLLNVLYLPSKKMYEHIPFEFERKIEELPPGVEIKNNISILPYHTINLLYVGGLGKLYNLELFCKSVLGMNNLQMTICTRKEEWKLNRNKYEKFVSKNLKIEHFTGSDLQKLYEKTDIAILFVEPTEYWKFVMAMKLFEYLSFKKPIIAVKDTAVGCFVEENNIGWVIDYDEKELKTLLLSLQTHPEQIEEKINNIEEIIPKHTWEARAKQVVSDLA